MRENIIQGAERGADDRWYIPGDWHAAGIPANVQAAADVYIQTSYLFSAFHSQEPVACQIGKASGLYDNCNIITGRAASIRIGAFSILNGTSLISQASIEIGDHCMLAWGSVLCDSLISPGLDQGTKAVLLEKIAQHPERPFPCFSEPKPIVLEDNCWVGFDAVILPGVRLGRGCVVGSKTVIQEDVPPYAVVVGNPARIIRYLAPTDTEAAKKQALGVYLQKEEKP